MLVFVSVRGLSLVAASGVHSSLRCVGLSPSRPLLLRVTGSRRAGSAVVAHGPSCSTACGIFLDQGSNPCPPHWQADSQPLHHQRSPMLEVFKSQFQFQYLWLVCSYFVIFPGSVLEGCTFLRICPFLLGCLFVGIQLLVVVSYDPFYFCGVHCNFFFSVSNFIYLSLLPFFLDECD